LPHPSPFSAPPKPIGGTAGALVAAALAVYGPTSSRVQAAELRDKLIAAGVTVPPWTLDLGRVEPGRVVMLSNIWGDGCSIHLDCLRNAETIGIGTTIDAVGGVIAHGFSYGPNTAGVEKFALEAPDSVITEIDPADARATVDAALARADQYEDLDDDSGPDDPETGLRALVEQRFSLLAEGGSPLIRPVDPTESRAELTSGFLALEGTAELPDVNDLIDTFWDFSDYCDGDPLRWSPNRIHVFLAVWIPAKVIADELWYRNLPVVLREWLRFAATERELSDRALELNLSAVGEALKAMQRNRLDPTKASPGSAIMRELLADQVDVENQAETQAWIDQHNTKNDSDEP